MFLSKLPLPRFFRSRMTATSVLIVLAYAYVGKVFPIGPLSEGLRVAQISLAAIVVVAYSKNAWRCYTLVGRWPRREELIALGIVMSWASVLANGLWGLLWRLSGQPPWMVNNDWYNAWVVCNCSAAILHVWAPNIFGPDVPKIDRLKLIAIFSVMVVGMTFVSVVRPDMRPVANWLRQWMEEPLTSVPLASERSPFEMDLGLAHSEPPP